jgi:gamma-glutamyltranspeptidase/glutathione hydrolase
VQEAIDAPRIHHQFLPDLVQLEPFALSPDTSKLLAERGYHLVQGRQWGVAEAILAGAPSLAAVAAGPDGNPLPVGAAPAPGATLFGAHDVRGGAGKASGVQ